MDHVVTIGESISIVAVCRTKKRLVNTNAVLVSLVCTDGTAGGQQAVGITDRDESQWGLLKLACLKFLSRQRRNFCSRIIQAADLEWCATYERVNNVADERFIRGIINDSGLQDQISNSLIVEFDPETKDLASSARPPGTSWLNTYIRKFGPVGCSILNSTSV